MRVRSWVSLLGRVAFVGVLLWAPDSRAQAAEDAAPQALAGQDAVDLANGAATMAGIAAAVATPSAGWSTSTVDATGGFMSSLSFAPNGYPAIGYSGSNDEVRFAAWDGATWSTQIVTRERSSGNGISLAYDSSGNPSLSYSPGGLKFARWNGSSWSIQTIENGSWVDSVTSLVYQGGQPSIAYIGKAGLKLAVASGSTWTTAIVDRTGSSYPSLAYAPDGNPSIAYRGASGSLDALKFAHKSSSGWTIQVVDTGATGTGVFASLAYDPLSRNPTIAYTDSSGGHVKFAFFDGSAWNLEVVASNAHYAWLSYDSAGTASIAYTTSGDLQLQFAQRSGCFATCWQTQVVEDESPNRAQWRPTLAFSPTNAASISFGINVNQGLKFAQQVP
jgi:hypothetical protein